MSNRLRLFFAATIFLTLANLLVVNDWMTFWNGAEANLLLAVQDAQGFFLPVSGVEFFANSFGFSAFAVRLPGIVLFLLTIGGFFLFGKKIFGTESLQYTFLVLGSTLLLVNLSKFVTADIWLFAMQTLAVLALVRYLKEPQLQWQIALFTCTTLAALVQVWSTLVLTIGLATYLYFLHPQGKRLGQSYLWALWLVLLPIFYFRDTLQTINEYFFLDFSWSSIGNYFLLNGLSILPWAGFFLAALWHMFKRLQKQEELAIITGGWFIVALLAQSLAVQAVIAIIVAKQVIGWRDKNYPYGNIVKTGALLQLIGFFLAAMVGLIGGYLRFEGLGYRVVLSVSAAYWIWSFVGTLGLYLNNRPSIISGMTISGMLAMLFFWLQFYPAWENYRSLPKRAVAEASKLAYQNKSATLYIAAPDSLKLENMLLYAKEEFAEVERGTDLKTSTNFDVLLTPKPMYSQPDTTRRSTVIEGWLNSTTLEQWYAVDVDD